MSELGRRGFLQGLIASVTVGSVIVEATNDDIARFGTKVGDSAVLGHGAISNITPPRPGQSWQGAIDRGAMTGGMWLLYNHAGQAVAAVRSANMTAPVDGLTKIDMEVVDLGPVTHQWLIEGLGREHELRRQGRK